MERAKKFGQMEQSSKVSIKKEESTDMEHFHGLMARCTKVNLLITT